MSKRKKCIGWLEESCTNNPMTKSKRCKSCDDKRVVYNRKLFENAMDVVKGWSK